jgi:hypothetical protein
MDKERAKVVAEIEENRRYRKRKLEQKLKETAELRRSTQEIMDYFSKLPPRRKQY